MSRLRIMGQSIVEFALLIPLMILIIMGAIDFGRAFHMKIAMTNAAREGAYYLSYNPSDISNCASDCYAGTILAVQNEAVSTNLSIQPGDITISNCCTRGQPVEVTVSAPINFSILGFFTGPVQMSSSARFLVQK